VKVQNVLLLEEIMVLKLSFQQAVIVSS